MSLALAFSFLSGLLPERQRHMDISRKCGFHRPSQRLSALHIVDIRLGIYLEIDYAYQPSPLQELANVTGGIVEVPESTGPGGTSNHAGRLPAKLQASLAIITLIGNTLGRAKETGAIWAGRNTIPAFDTD
jgi:hypothetical protein